MRRWICAALTIGASTAVWAGGVEAEEYRYGKGAERLLAAGPHQVALHVSSDFEVVDGLSILHVRDGSGRRARLVSDRLAATLYGDLAPVGEPDGKITAGDAWVTALSQRDRSKVDRLLLSGARRLLYEMVPKEVWLGHDHLGSTTVESDSKGGEVGRHTYAPFGRVLRSSGDRDRYGFTGQRSDGGPEIDFQYRRLDSAIGRWLSADPAFEVVDQSSIGMVGESTAAYAYVANNPASQIDPTGLKKQAPLVVSSPEISARHIPEPPHSMPMGRPALLYDGRRITVYNRRAYFESTGRSDRRKEAGLFYEMRGVQERNASPFLLGLLNGGGKAGWIIKKDLGHKTKAAHEPRLQGERLVTVGEALTPAAVNDWLENYGVRVDRMMPEPK